MRIAWWLHPGIGMTPRERLRRAVETATIKLAYRLPRSLVMWCSIRVMANATTGAYSSQVVPDLTAMEALQRWDEQTNEGVAR